MSWTISKEFNFCYGHRVFVQKLNQDYCGDDNKAKCRHLHGHEGRVHVHLQGGRLNDQSMVTDFKHLGWLKKFIDDTIDHKFIFCDKDPMFETLAYNIHKHQPPRKAGVYQVYKDITVPGTDFVVGKVFNLDNDDKATPEYETLEGYLIVDFVPTSENLAKWMYNIVHAKMKLIDVDVSHIEWWETPKSQSIYKPGN